MSVCHVIVLLLLCLAVSRSLQLTITDTPSLEHVHRLMQAVEFHHENYKRSLKDLDDALDALPREQILLLKEKTRRSKRSEVGQLFNSFLAFCGTLKNEPTNGTRPTVAEKPSVDRVETYDKKRSNSSLSVFSQVWRKQNVPFRVVNLRTKRFTKMLVVEVTVEYNVPVSYYTRPTQFLKVRPVGKKNLKNADNSKRVSKFKVKFALDRCPEHHRRRGEIAQIQISGKGYDSKLISINLFPCSSSEPSNQWKELQFNNIEMNLTLPNNVITTGKGKKTMFEVQLDNKVTSFDISTMEYNKDSGLLGYSEIYLELENRRSPPSETICSSYYHKSIYAGNENSTSLVDVQKCRTDNYTKSDPNHGPRRKKENNQENNLENNQPPIIEVYVDTVESKRSGIIWLGVGEPPETRTEISLIMGWSYYIPVLVVEKPKQKPIPSDKIVFMGRQDSICNTNPIATAAGWDDGSCGLICRVAGGDIASVTFIKDQRDLSLVKSTDYDLQSLTHVNSATATLKINKKDAKFNGEYICRATSTSGHTEEQTMTLAVGSMPFIDETKGLTVRRNDDDDKVLINCTASGSDLDISVYANEVKPEFRLDKYRGIMTQPSPDHKSLLVDVPLDDLENYGFYNGISCLAENNIANITRLAFLPSESSHNYTASYSYDY